MNVFSEDSAIRDEMIRCCRDISAYLNINIVGFHTEVIKGLSTSFVISLFSKANKNKLRFNIGQDGHWVYFLRCDDDEIDAMNLEYFVPLETFRSLVDTIWN
ncbi:hypothetical protein AZF37_04320 [endosymbiont 'TC1' of Trimyema compressum]|uniref:hypothetical protein n=1 Tax=endosymbiont 'TC1' of Trimyema compressum TaxID=243899 RepID=UPI0007F152E1|nr:hypothetical protein [endosymbiont 'TC1' of Trimyema compressum]AMP20494.1 hypothetical protein AZF37_04320 [endosymbiont 'TC1' of Trimyema compressum]